MRTTRIALGFTASLLAWSVAAVAAPETTRGNKDLKTYCSGDAVTFCTGNDPNSPEMDACFQKNMDKISENCRRAITAYKAGGGK
ncbi:3',5'-cyclic-nucleotide phosphodiesterase [Methylobacterium sp. J-030]|uniref:3',5'-cyclic-nucleotide phosphodiesterase n=1 Tax=Methylobacterium sp. J-030 TaxID=2836627 RepID=UPI001FB8EC95|nr:3',5'-cyclic-nucleotide phosphodiesterase [Methylobacterium sp. J-030]MCJ2068562.1 3',5'-cyclic-nucleotide phosphodiesterase [Methylobacterium sp. J-030]